MKYVCQDKPPLVCWIEFHEDSDNKIYCKIWKPIDGVKKMPFSQFADNQENKLIIRDIYKTILSGYSEFIIRIIPDIYLMNNATQSHINFVLKKFISQYLSADDDNEKDIEIYTSGQVIINIDSGLCNRVCPILTKIEKFVKNERSA